MGKTIKTRTRIEVPAGPPEGDPLDPVHQSLSYDYFWAFRKYEVQLADFVEDAGFWDRLWFAFTRQAWITSYHREDDEAWERAFEG